MKHDLQATEKHGDGSDILKDMASHLHTLLKKRGLADQEAQEIGQATADHIRHLWGGQQLYIVKDAKSARNAEIFRKFDGGNVPALAFQYDLSVAQIYKIIRQERQKGKTGSPPRGRHHPPDLIRAKARGTEA